MNPIYTNEEIDIEILRNDVKTQSKLNTNVGPAKLIRTSVLSTGMHFDFEQLNK